MKAFFAFAGLLVAGLTLAGCSTTAQTGNTNQVEQQPRGDQATATSTWANDGGATTPASVADLAVGGQVMVMGTTNADGSISANQILLGEAGTDFSVFGRNLPPPGSSTNDSSTDTNNTDRNAEQMEQPMGEPPADFQGPAGGFQGGPPNGFQGPSGERQAQTTNSSATKRVRTGSQGMVRVTGEIIEKTDTNLTVKLADGGSKLVFFSDMTTVAKVQPPEAEPAQ